MNARDRVSLGAVLLVAIAAGAPATAQQATPSAAPPQVPPSPVMARALPPAPRATGPTVTLTLDEALGLGQARSEQLAIATAGVDRARAVEQRAHAERFPQLFGAASYDRTLASEFKGIFDNVDGGLTGNGDVDLPFGRANAYRLSLAFEQPLYTGGRVAAQERQARLGRETASISLQSTRAQTELDVARAFFDAVLSDWFVLIAEATYEQANRTYEQTRAQRDAGRQSEFDQLRAQVERDTLLPEVIRRRASRDVAYLQLKQLLELPADTNLELSAPMDPDVPPAERFRESLAAAEAGLDTRERLGISVAANTVAVTEEAVRITRAQRLPTVGLNSAYGLVNYDLAPAFDQFRTNWTVGAVVQVPIFTGGRVKADEAIARADVEEARQRLKLARELAFLDVASARQELVAARAAWEATGGTVRQAQRAYEIAELRYREGLSTQLELSDARLLRQQAEVNRAVAARDLQLTRVRLALLPELPLTTAGASGISAANQRLNTALSVSGTFAQPTGVSTGRTGSAGVQQR